MFDSVLIANRGEIACRVVRACRALGLRSVAVYSEADADAPHAALADAAEAIGPADPRASYLDIGALLAAAERSGAGAVHPGYGFLAESAEFARRVEEAGLAWVGPAPETIADMGDKERARRLAAAAGVPVLPGSGRLPPGGAAELAAAGARVGYPLLVKAAAGGGGIGMRRADGPAELERAAAAARTMAERAFGDGGIYLERLVAPARHLEVQVFGFGDGGAAHFFERDCSVQRRFQKVVEEAPAPGLAPGVRRAMAEAALALARAVRYRGAGTVEFVAGPGGEFFFLEMNTRIQVEHPVTEMLTGVDLVAGQLRLARGDALEDFRRGGAAASGHAVECRIYAERPERRFLPAPGRITALRWPPAGPDLRIDSGVREGGAVTPHYDPLIAKVAARGDSRGAALARMAAALAETRIDGLSTNLEFLRRVVAHPDFRAGGVATDFVETRLAELAGGGAPAADQAASAAARAAAKTWRKTSGSCAPERA